jgi:hypothetical protein
VHAGGVSRKGEGKKWVVRGEEYDDALNNDGWMSPDETAGVSGGNS